MNDLKEGDKAYTIHPVITEYYTECFGEGVCFKELKTFELRNGDTFKTKNEAIDALIKILEDMRN